MSDNIKRPKEGTVNHVDESDGRRSFGARPKVHRYNSGDNAHGVRQRSPSAPEPGEKSGHARGDGPRKSYTGK
jgi:hypothetical protein